MRLGALCRPVCGIFYSWASQVVVSLASQSRVMPCPMRFLIPHAPHDDDGDDDVLASRSLFHGESLTIDIIDSDCDVDPCGFKFQPSCIMCN